MTVVGASRSGLGMPVTASAAIHAALIAAFFLLRPAESATPPIYRVTMIAAPAGARAIGVVQHMSATPAATQPAPIPPRPKAPPRTAPAPTATHAAASLPKLATPLPPVPKPVPSTVPPPAAGGGPTGGRGADVANVNTAGIDFPFPGYLDNIMRQVALRFKPSSGGALRADVAFLIRRDGAVPLTSIRIVRRSGVYSFDLEAQGAIEAAANAHAFGPLPTGFSDDVLPVTFRFDPRVIR